MASTVAWVTPLAAAGQCQCIGPGLQRGTPGVENHSRLLGVTKGWLVGVGSGWLVGWFSLAGSLVDLGWTWYDFVGLSR